MAQGLRKKLFVCTFVEGSEIHHYPKKLKDIDAYVFYCLLKELYSNMISKNVVSSNIRIWIKILPAVFRCVWK